MKTWAEKIAALEQLGWTLTGIGKAIELSPQALSDIKQCRSTEPRGMAAVRLHALHEAGEAPPPRAAANEEASPLPEAA